MCSKTTHKFEVEMRLCWSDGTWTDCNFVTVDAPEDASTQEIEALAIEASKKRYIAEEHLLSYIANECVCHEHHNSTCNCNCCQEWKPL